MRRGRRRRRARGIEGTCSWAAGGYTRLGSLYPCFVRRITSAEQPGGRPGSFAVDPDIWMEIDVRAAGGEVWVSAEDGSGERAEARSLGPGSCERLARMTAAVEAAVARRLPLSEAW